MTEIPIRAVAFDMGGTLEDICYDDASRVEAARGLRSLLIDRGLDPGMPLQDLLDIVLSGMKGYQEWREQSEIELPPERVWSQYVFNGNGRSLKRPPEWDVRLAAAAEEISQFYENHFYMRRLRPEAPDALAALRGRGVRLAVISNVISRLVVQQNLARYGVAHYFDPVVTSAGFGRRKPNASIFLETSRLMRFPPAACAYVGDTVSRDVIGARSAGYGLAIQIKSFLTERADRGTASVRPDAVIHDLTEVANLVTRRPDSAPS
jgi:putative hydrolase of the HAD superfamily